MVKKSILFLSIISLCLLGCIFESDHNHSEDTFSFEVQVVDDAGLPVPGLSVSLISPINVGMYGSSSQTTRAQTVILFNIMEQCYVRISIEDITGELITELFSETLDAAYYSVQWDGKDSDSQAVPSGVYFCRMQASSDGEEFYNERIMMYLLSYSSENRNGMTDDEGLFLCESFLPFPSFYDLDSLNCTNEYLEIVDVIAFPDSIDIYLSNPESPEMYQSVRVLPKKDSYQKINIVWEPETREGKTVRSSALEGRDANGSMPPLPSTGLVGNYPNPFN